MSQGRSKRSIIAPNYPAEPGVFEILARRSGYGVFVTPFRDARRWRQTLPGNGPSSTPPPSTAPPLPSTTAHKPGAPPALPAASQPPAAGSAQASATIVCGSESPHSRQYRRAVPASFPVSSQSAASWAAAFGGAQTFTEGVDATLNTPKGLPVVEGADGVYYPGERSATMAAERGAKGIPVAAMVWRELTDRAAESGGVLPG